MSAPRGTNPQDPRDPRQDSRPDPEDLRPDRRGSRPDQGAADETPRTPATSPVDSDPDAVEAAYDAAFDQALALARAHTTTPHPRPAPTDAPDPASVLAEEDAPEKPREAYDWAAVYDAEDETGGAEARTGDAWTAIEEAWTGDVPATETRADGTSAGDGRRDAGPVAPHRDSASAEDTTHGPDRRAAPSSRSRSAAVRTWEEARGIALRAARETVARTAARPVPLLPLEEARGLALAEPLTALTDLPSFDTSAMDGWAVAGPGPWRLLPGAKVLAGHQLTGADGRLDDGAAVPVATGARVPGGTTGVLRSEHGEVTAEGTRLHALRPLAQGEDIRPRGQECRTGDALVDEGTVVTAPVLGLAAAAGYDAVRAHPRPTAEIFVLGDELLGKGIPADGLIRDALGPMLPAWLDALGTRVLGVHRLRDEEDCLAEALAASEADLVLTTGGTAAGPVDHVRPVLSRLGARLLVDGVAVRPGHPMLLAATAPGQHLVGLPGNPLAAVAGLLTLAAPLLTVLAGRDELPLARLPLAERAEGHPRDTRLLPVRVHEGRLCPLRYNGPAMLRGIANADSLAVVLPGGAEAGTAVEVLDLPRAGGCFT
ncbi:molybdopterin-binding protein [Streptomyces sp. AM 3-1-1]|uniref:molybdopterin molybdotransferase MoeA n=1 Tax=Streptomyces sp. AM 3-1-1 TaxID=3028711 RepID=UPI0031B9D36F